MNKMNINLFLPRKFLINILHYKNLKPNQFKINNIKIKHSHLRKKSTNKIIINNNKSIDHKLNKNQKANKKLISKTVLRIFLNNQIFHKIMNKDLAI